MTGTVKFFWCSLLFFGLGSCESRIYEGTPETACNGGECEYNFEINPEQQPDAYLDNEGYWHVYTGGMSYFQIIGELEGPYDFYHINGTPDVRVAMDSDYWITFDTISFTTPMYGVLSWYSSPNMEGSLLNLLLRSIICSFDIYAIFYLISYNGLQICDVADLVAQSFILLQMLIRSRMLHLPLNPPYSQMCCYGLVILP